MKNFCLNRSLAVLTALVGWVATTQADDLASIFTNIHPKVALANRTSIIFIQCHGLGFGDLSCYGQTNFQTPNLDKLAAEGIRFNHYSPGDTNLVAVQSALMTGKNSAAPGDNNLAQMLKRVGYRTGLYGEWNLGDQPWKQGFDRFAGFLKDDEGRNYYPDYFWRYDPVGHVDVTNLSVQPFVGRESIQANLDGKKNSYLPDFLLGTVLKNCIHNDQPDRFNHFRPFFLLMNVPAPRSASADKVDFPVPSDAPYSDEPWPQAAKNRAALISRIDNNIGRMFEELNKAGMTNDIMVVFTSSAPPEKFADKKLDFFHTPADVQSRTAGDWSAPMIVWWPGHIPAGQVSDFKWSPVDFLPTAAVLSYAKTPEKIDGKSILPVLLGKQPAQP